MHNFLEHTLKENIQFLYFDSEYAFLKQINSDGQYHVLNKVKAEANRGNKIRENLFLELLEWRVSTSYKNELANFDENKLAYARITLIFEVIFYLTQLYNNKENLDFLTNSYNDYLNSFKSENQNYSSNEVVQPEDFL